MSRNAAFVYSDAMSRHVLRSDHPMKPLRLRYTYELLEAYRAFDGEGSVLVEPRAATDEEILNLHDSDYLEAVKALSKGERTFDPARYNFSAMGDNPFYEGMYDAAALSTGASLMVADMVGRGEIGAGFNISGGLHHAAPRSASGFCVFNDPAVVIKHLVNLGLKVAYVDIDAHHGDGVQDAFYDTDQVLTISIHESGRFLFPGTGSTEEVGTGPGRGYSVNVPLYPSTEDDLYLWAFREVVPPLIRAFAPDILVTQLGIDSYHSDPLTHLLLSSNGYGEAVREFSGMGIPWIGLGGGGYDLSAVARCWTIAYGIMSGREWPDDIPASYRERYGFERLRDPQEVVSVPDNTKREAEVFARSSVETLKRLVFPMHKISS